VLATVAPTSPRRTPTENCVRKRKMRVQLKGPSQVYVRQSRKTPHAPTSASARMAARALLTTCLTRSTRCPSSGPMQRSYAAVLCSGPMHAATLASVRFQ
jgi:hypothetical protein